MAGSPADALPWPLPVSVAMQAMSDAGLKPLVVYHNLSPAELYEKVGWRGRRRQEGCGKLG